MNINNLTIPSYYYRDYNNDLPKYSDQVIRVAKVALPFIALYRPLGMALTCGLGIARAITAYTSHKDLSWTLFNWTCAIASIAGTIFLHPLGMLITTLNDIGVNCTQAYGAIGQGDYVETAKQIMYLANCIFYAAIIVYGSLELQVASLVVQVLVEGMLSIDEYRQGHWLEATGHLVMSAIRVNQLHTKVHQLTRKWEIDEAIKSIYVGELHEKWQFPSDHLPVGIEVNGTKIITWNVLNNAYIEWVTKIDSQGLKGSMISDLNVPINNEKLTQRDQRVIEMLLSMMDPKTGIITLQECGQPFVNALEKVLPDEWQMIKSSQHSRIDQEIVLYNSDQLTMIKSETVRNGIPCDPGRIIQNTLFDQNGKNLRIINSHLPGDPALPGRDEFARYVKNHTLSDEITVALGDMNFNHDEMDWAYRQAGLYDFMLHSPWHTNVDPQTRKSKGIDHLFVSGTTDSRDLRIDEIAAPEFLLQETVDLLRAMPIQVAEQVLTG